MGACIQQSIRNYPFVTCNHLRYIVQHQTGIRISRQLVSVALKRLGFSKVKARPTNFEEDAAWHGATVIM
jgi:transposase